MSRYLVSITIGCVIFVAGITLCITDFTRYKYIDKVPPNDMIVKEVIIEQTFEDKEFKVNSHSANIIMVEDDNIEPTEIKFKISYYSEFVSLGENIVVGPDFKRLHVYVNYREPGFEPIKRILDLTTINLENKEVYNYSLLFKPTITIYVNSLAKDNVKIMN